MVIPDMNTVTGMTKALGLIVGKRTFPIASVRPSHMTNQKSSTRISNSSIPVPQADVRNSHHAEAYGWLREINEKWRTSQETQSLEKFRLALFSSVNHMYQCDDI
jgi:hypothetical protein